MYTKFFEKLVTLSCWLAHILVHQGVRIASYSECFVYLLSEWPLSETGTLWKRLRKLFIWPIVKEREIDLHVSWRDDHKYENLRLQTGWPKQIKILCSINQDLWSNGLVVKALDSQSRSPVFKTTGWLQGRLSLSFFRGRWNEYQEFLGTEW